MSINRNLEEFLVLSANNSLVHSFYNNIKIYQLSHHQNLDPCNFFDIN